PILANSTSMTKKVEINVFMFCYEEPDLNEEHPLNQRIHITRFLHCHSYSEQTVTDSKQIIINK
ncbi:MAG: hypothetical protein K2K25_08615, partial [Muribaculaceae bacterium]|nr:hypothetical protein [Muribaculaceae bacterium]